MKTNRIIPVVCIFLLAGILLYCASCKKDSNAPIACITSLPDTVAVNQAVSFSSCSAATVACLWNFGDGTTATGSSAVHVYTAAGIYHGSLTTANNAGTAKSFTITVLANPMGYFTVGAGYFLPNQWDTAQGHQIDASEFVNSKFAGNISLYFYNPFPIPGGSYNAVYQYSSQVQPNGVALNFSNNSASYTVSPSNTQKVVVSQNQNGKLVISGSNIEMMNFYNSSDSLPVTFSITQP